MLRPLIGLGPLLLLIPLLAMGRSSPGESDLDAGLQLFRQNKIQEALPFLQRAAGDDDRKAEALAWLGETHRRLGNNDEALKSAQQSLRLEPRNSFAHLVIAEALFPYGGGAADYDTVWYHIDQAVACDSTDGNAWQMMWAKGIFKADLPLFHKVLRKMVETGFLTDAALAYGRWELQCLPPNAVLLTNGDMDTFPAQAVQVTERLRPDAVVIERGLLDTPTGRRFVRDELGVHLPYDEGEFDSPDRSPDAAGETPSASRRILAGWIDRRTRGAFTRPIAFAPTVQESYYKEYRDHLLYSGPFLLWQPESVSVAVDTAVVRLSLDHIDPGAFSGPWVGDNDRSPVRRVYTKNLAGNITHMALAYAGELIESGQLRQAGDVLDWTEGFERHTELGPVSDSAIGELREELHRKDRNRK